jgi:hypothetical protein
VSDLFLGHPRKSGPTIFTPASLVQDGAEGPMELIMGTGSNLLALSVLAFPSHVWAGSDRDPNAAMVQESMKPIASFASYLEKYCIKYVQVETNDLYQMIIDLKDTPYPTDEYFQKAGCKLLK